jgi:lipid II:glycine glycyltransferase (peptidoglycan interpeptide bridge formation enzyme)
VLELDLQPGAEAILAACDESARYKIRRAPREGVLSALETDSETFATFYNAFAETKELGALDPSHFSRYWPAMTVTKAVYDGANLAMHAYFVDHAASRATLLYSCSHFRNVEDSKQRNFLARASRFLYWDDMRRFEALGIRWFDFGYFGNAAQIGQVNEFKKGYPCVEKPVSTYISLPLYFLRRLTQPSQPF